VSNPKNKPPLTINEQAYKLTIDDKVVYGVRSCYSRWHEKSYMKHFNDMNSTLKSLDIDGKESVPIIRSRGESFSTAIRTTVSSSRSRNNRKSLDSGLQSDSEDETFLTPETQQTRDTYSYDEITPARGTQGTTASSSDENYDDNNPPRRRNLFPPDEETRENE